MATSKPKKSAPNKRIKYIKKMHDLQSGKFYRVLVNTGPKVWNIYQYRDGSFYQHGRPNIMAGEALRGKVVYIDPDPKA